MTALLPWGIAAAGLALGLLGGHELESAGHALGSVAREVVVGWAFIGAGLLLRYRRPTNRSWALLTAAGLAWFVGDFAPSANEDLRLIGFAGSRWYVPLLWAALLVFPAGTLSRRADRVIVVAVGLLAGLRTFGRAFLHVPPDFIGCGCVENRFLPIRDDRWWRAVEDWYDRGSAIAAVVVVGAVAARWLGSSGPARRLLTWPLVASTALAFAVFQESVRGWNLEVLGDGSGIRSSDLLVWTNLAVALSLVAGFARLRATRAAVVEVVGELGDGRPPAGLGNALARALGDPTLRLLSWSGDAYCDSAGGRVELPTDDATTAITRIERDGEPLAALVHDPTLLEDPGLVRAIAASVRLTADNARLEQELNAQLAEVDASRARIVAAGDAERRRIERDLHDGAQQRLVTIALSLRLAQLRLGSDGDEATRRVLSSAVDDLTQAIDDLRNLARGIHPAILTESGLAAALQSLADRAPVPVSVDVCLPHEPDPATAATAYFCVAEALTNIAKHAAAAAASVEISTAGDLLRLLIRDDGAGGAEPTPGSGLSGLADRVAAMGGTLRIDSPAGDSTSIEVRLPCAWS